MKTEDLVSLLATELEPVHRNRAGRRLVAAFMVGAAVSLLLVVTILRPYPDLSRELRIPMFWVRSFYCGSLALVGLVAVDRLGRPGRRLGLVPAALAAPVATMWLLAAVVLTSTEGPARLPLVLGHTAYACPWLIAFLSLPLLVTLTLSLRDVAPTRLRLTGATAGFAAGAGGALVYTLHCPELASPFLALWYLLGMLLPAVLGAALGPRLLRW